MRYRHRCTVLLPDVDPHGRIDAHTYRKTDSLVRNCTRYPRVWAVCRDEPA